MINSLNLLSDIRFRFFLFLQKKKKKKNTSYSLKRNMTHFSCTLSTILFFAMAERAFLSRVLSAERAIIQECSCTFNSVLNRSRRMRNHRRLMPRSVHEFDMPARWLCMVHVTVRLGTYVRTYIPRLFLLCPPLGTMWYVCRVECSRLTFEERFYPASREVNVR